MLLYTLTRFFVRASIILFYLRVFPPKDNNKLGRLIQYTMVFNVVYNLSFFIAVLFQCTPISLFWTSWEGHQEGYCGNANILVWVAAATGIVYDLWLLALPFPQLLALNVHWKKKVMGGMMFCVGAAYVTPLRPPSPLPSPSHPFHASVAVLTDMKRHNYLAGAPQNHQRVHPNREPNQ
jgi:hypothetical protein